MKLYPRIYCETHGHGDMLDALTAWILPCCNARVLLWEVSQCCNEMVRQGKDCIKGTVSQHSHLVTLHDLGNKYAIAAHGVSNLSSHHFIPTPFLHLHVSVTFPLPCPQTIFGSACEYVRKHSGCSAGVWSRFWCPCVITAWVLSYHDHRTCVRHNIR